MTSLICWAGVDSRGPASIYLASDSRISWSPGGIWDRGRKVFACNTSPELLGYLGQVLFPSQALSQARDLIDAGLLFTTGAPPEQKRDAIFGIVKEHFRTYPVERDQVFTVVHCTRHREGMDSTFHVSTLSWRTSCGWQEEVVSIPSVSGIIKAWGSGEAAIDTWYKRWMNTQQGRRTSRSVFSAFCDALSSGEDSFTGGAPQLVGVYRRGGGATFGLVYAGRRYTLGVRVEDHGGLSKIEWRNALFERCDGQMMNRLESAQRHQRPGGLGRAL